MSIQIACNAKAFRNHLSERVGRLDPVKDWDEIKRILDEMTTHEAVSQQPQLAQILRDIAKAKRPGYVNLLRGLGKAGPGLVVQSFTDAAPALASWWRVSRDTCFIFGQILGDAETFIEETRDVTEIRIDSMGGCSRTALKIAEAFAGRKVKTVVTGRCCSAAVGFLLMGEPRLIERNARVMVHSPRLSAFGTPEELRNEALRLADSVDDVVNLYRSRTGLQQEVIRQWFDGADHYFTAEQAVALGFADEIYDAPPADPVELSPVADVAPADPGNESLFLQWIASFGDIRVKDRAKFMREMHAFFTYNTKTV